MNKLNATAKERLFNNLYQAKKLINNALSCEFLITDIDEEKEKYMIDIFDEILTALEAALGYDIALNPNVKNDVTIGTVTRKKTENTEIKRLYRLPQHKKVIDKICEIGNISKEKIGIK